MAACTHPRHTPRRWPRVQRVVRAGPSHMQYCNPRPSWSHSITEHVSPTPPLCVSL
ncbi:elastin, isoform CRA_d [Rattus norvegicus]|uniref:Elastin, isoform CRA_d n=1 Tax=Rattus norvegicus TaxID=10116 RepID=A6J0H6_RAT|nr:elastin, isoform CRA_d [Rattus norvegicus]